MNQNTYMTIGDLKRNEVARIKGFLSEEIPAKFYEMGLLPGNEISLVRKALFSDPVIVRVSGTKVAIRKQEAKQILIEKENSKQGV